MIRRCTSLLVAALLMGSLGCSTSDPGETRDVPPEPATSFPTQPARILIDGASSDWEDASVRHADPEGDGQTLDLGRLWVAHDAERLFLRLEVGATVNLQEGNDLTLYLDTDADASTGTSARGLGAELTWTFGERSGRVHRGGDTVEVRHEDLGFASLPTVRSSVFEVALDRSATPGGAALFAGDSLRIALSGGGDQLPDADGGVGYAFSSASLPDLDAATLGRSQAGDLRLLSYNVQRDRFFDAAPRSSYSRILQAVQADVVGLQEVYEHSAEETLGVFNDLYGASTGATWQAAKAGLDLVLLTRYPIEASHTISGYEGNRSGAFLLDTRDALGTPLVYVLTHPPCCNYADATPSRDAQRQQVVDAIAAFVRDVKAGEGPFAVPDRTPIVVAGDMNFVGSPQNAETLRTGTIVNTDRYGEGTAPDWDDSPLLDTNPRQAGTPLHVTWDDPGSSFPPGRLDYTYVSDSVVEVVNEYVLHTPALPASTLAAHGLEADDTRTASDHLPLVVDITAR
jgi:endonuclease/exonuclease/phosphatase family metal-dependent hydrolase